MTDNTHQTISVLGAGYVGLTTAALFANAGYTVYILEPNKERLDAIKQGRSFFYEEGIDVLIKTAVDNRTLIPTDSYEDCIPKSSVIFSCVGTPDNPDGSSNLRYVFDAVKSTLSYIEPHSIYVQKSTVPVGTGARIEELFSQSDESLSYISNPEFLRESTAIYDTLYFDRVVAGGNDVRAVEAVLDIYRTLEKHRDTIADLADIAKNSRAGVYIATGLNSAELIKVTANAFLAMKISFANSIAKLSDAVGADVNEVMDAVGADERIGRKFLNAGRGFGGGCFPKDVSGLIASSKEYGVDMDIMESVQDVNTSMPSYIIDKIEKRIGKSLKDTNVAVLGLSFKGGTSDIRKSPGIAIVNALVERSAHVSAYDPQANEEARPQLPDSVVLHDSVESVVKDIEVVIVATEWREFLDFDIELLASYVKDAYFVDAIDAFDIAKIEDTGLTYVGVGR